MGYRGIFITVVILSVFPEVFHNGYYLLRYKMLWSRRIQRDKETLCAHEHCLYVAERKDWYFYVMIIVGRFVIVLMAFSVFSSSGLRQAGLIALVGFLTIGLLLCYCRGICQLCIVTKEHVFVRCLNTLWVLKAIDVKNVSQYERVWIPTRTHSYYVDIIHADDEVFKISFARDGDALISVLDQIVPQETLERNKVAAKKHDAENEKFMLIWVAVFLSYPLILMALILLFPKFLR